LSRVVVTFTRLLTPYPTLNQLAWSATANKKAVIFGATFLAGPDLVLSEPCVLMGSNPPPDRISYDGTDPHLLDSDGIPVPAFTDFPLTYQPPP